MIGENRVFFRMFSMTTNFRPLNFMKSGFLYKNILFGLMYTPIGDLGGRRPSLRVFKRLLQVLPRMLKLLGVY